MLTKQLSHQGCVTANLNKFNLKYRTSSPKTTPVLSDIMGRLIHHAIDYGDFEVHPSEYPFKYTSESVPDTDTSLIK